MAQQKTIGERIKAFRLSKGLSVPAFAKMYNLNKANLYKWEGGTKPSHYEDGIELEKILFSETIPNNNVLNDGEATYKTTKKSIKSKDLQNPNKAIETVYNLAESNKTLVDSHKLLVETNANLVSMIKSITKTIGDSGQDNAAGVEAKFDVLLEAIAEVAAGKRYHSKQEAVATLGKLFYARSGS